MRFAWLLVLAIAGCGRWGFSERVTPGPDATDAADEDAPLPDAPDRPNRIFMTSTMYDANLGGLAGADARCGDRAIAASLGGTWVALLYTDADVPASRVAGSRGWVDLNGLVIADDPASLEHATANPLRFDEFGVRIPTPFGGSPQAWWGGHLPASPTCTDWTSNVDVQASTHTIDGNAAFDTDFYAGCSTQLRLICAETGHVAPSTPPVETGRNVFVTVARFGNTGGIAAADALCQAEAGTASLTGTYMAYLANANGPADARFSTAGLPWRRVNGPRLTQTAAALFGVAPQDPWDTFIARHADGSATVDRVTTGTSSENCANWTTNQNTQSLRLGSSHATQRARMTTFPATCNNFFPILCFEK